MKEALITFRLVTEADLPLILEWRHADHVVYTYGEGHKPTIEELRDRIESGPLTYNYIISYDGRPIGFIKTYLVSDYAEYQKQIHFFEPAAGIDLFIGDKAYVGQGLGRLVIKAFVRDVVFERFDIQICVADPHVNNIASIKAFEGAGFKHLKTIEVEGHQEYVVVFTAPRAWSA